MTFEGSHVQGGNAAGSCRRKAVDDPDLDVVSLPLEPVIPMVSNDVLRTLARQWHAPYKSAQCALALIQKLQDDGLSVLAWDFDNTLSRTQSGGLLDSVEAATWKIDQISPDAVITILVADLCGFKQGIASFNGPRVRQGDPAPDVTNGTKMIDLLLNNIGLKKYCPIVQSYFVPYHKTKHLERIAKYHDVKTSEVMLIDNCRINYQRAFQAGFSAITFTEEDPDENILCFNFAKIEYFPRNAKRPERICFVPCSKLPE